MISNLVISISLILIVITVLLIIKKPELIKQDPSKPLNYKNLSLKKIFIGDWRSFLIWILLMFLVWSYAHDTQACREMIQNIDEICIARLAEMSMANNSFIQLNLDGDDYRGAEESRGAYQQGSSFDLQGNS